MKIAPAHGQSPREMNPLLVVGSPPCTYFTALNELNKHLHRNDPVWLQKIDENLAKAKRHVRLCCSIYRYQIDQNRYFLHEHPAYATSWQEECMRGLMGEPTVETATCDQCMYGCKSVDGSPVKKPITFLTNAPELAKRLRMRCGGRGGKCLRPGGGDHAQCRGRMARLNCSLRL